LKNSIKIVWLTHSPSLRSAQRTIPLGRDRTGKEYFVVGKRRDVIICRYRGGGWHAYYNDVIPEVSERSEQALMKTRSIYEQQLN